MMQWASYIMQKRQLTIGNFFFNPYTVQKVKSYSVLNNGLQCFFNFLSNLIVISVSRGKTFHIPVKNIILDEEMNF